jgi:hypothetical protein
MLLGELAFEDRSNCLHMQPLQVRIKEGSNSASGIDDFDPDIGDSNGVDLKNDTIPGMAPFVELLGPVAVRILEVNPVEWDLHGGSAN